MVNIFDCVRNVASDKYGFIKIFILSIPAIMGTFAVLDGQDFFLNNTYVVFYILYLAVFFEAIRRSCNAEQMLMPSFLKPIKMFITLIGTMLSSILAVVVCIGIFYGFMKIAELNPQILNENISTYVFYGILSLLIVSVYFSSVTQYLDTGKIVDAYKPLKMINALKTFIVNFLFYLVQSAFLSCLLYIPALLIWFLNGMKPNALYITYVCMLSVFELFVLADYIGQTKKESESPYETLF